MSPRQSLRARPSALRGAYPCGGRQEIVVILISKLSWASERWFQNPDSILFPIHPSCLMTCRSKGTQRVGSVTPGFTVTPRNHCKVWKCKLVRPWHSAEQINPRANAECGFFRSASFKSTMCFSLFMPALKQHPSFYINALWQAYDQA